MCPYCCSHLSARLRALRLIDFLACGGFEIGWAFVNTGTGEVQSESDLVKPPLHWDMQPVWDPDAEKLHGISLEQLLAQGRPPLEVARRMNDSRFRKRQLATACFGFHPKLWLP